jgi:hypothetical protein
MLRNLFCAVVVLTIAGRVAAEEYSCSITKVDGDKVTVQKYKKGEKTDKGFKRGEKDGDPITLTASPTIKVSKVKFDFKSFKDKDAKKPEPTAVEDGLKNKMFTDISERGLRATVTVEGTTLTAVVVSDFGGFGGKKKKKDSN